jgi:cell division protein FtsW (lipid II flippase)
MDNFLKGRLIVVRLILLATVFALVGIGVLTIYAVSHPAESTPVADTAKLAVFWKKQIVYAVVGLLGFVAVNVLSYRRLGQASYWIYSVVLLLLFVVLCGRFVNIPFVPMKNGVHRWIQFRIAGHRLPSIQPSEFCKLSYILALAWYLRFKSNYRHFKSLIGPFALTVLPMVLILLEPDLGTVLLMMPILFTMLFVAGAKVKHLLIIILLAVLVSPMLWGQMNQYQRRRISGVFLQSERVQDAAEKHNWLGNILVGTKFTKKLWREDWGYQLERSKLSIASGGLTGYGFRKGPFIKYVFFLPEHHNDFIFATFAHQWGFLGCVVLLVLYAILIGCGLEIAIHNIDPFAKLAAIGIVTMFAVEVIVNVSMTLGLMPITGLTLPFVSYGGSSLLISLMSVGVLNNIGRSRPFTVAPRSFE